MTNEEMGLLAIKGMISELSAAEQEVCEELAEFIRMNVKRAGKVGIIALCLVGAEKQVEQANENGAHN